MPRIRDRLKAMLEGKSVIEWYGNKPGKWIEGPGVWCVDPEYLLTKPEVQRAIQKVKENGSL